MFFHERRQHSVGQGFFHTAYLRIGAGQFSYVYDCGSENSDTLAREVNDYADRRHERPDLNVLFISHFDSDHVNGLDRLLALVKTKTAVAPYLEPYERLMLIADAMDSGSLDGTLVQFAADPVRWLGDRGVEVVLFIAGDEDEEGPPIELPEPMPWPQFDEIAHGDVPLDLDLIGLRGRTTESGRPNTVTTSTGFKTESFVVPHRVALPLLAHGRFPVDWSFLTFVHPEGDRIRKFRAAIRREFGRTPLDNKRWTRSCSKWLADTVQQRVCRDKLADCYATIRRDRNLTSMSLYSGPITDAGAEGLRYACSWNGFAPDNLYRHLRYGYPRYWLDETKRRGWIGTGDANLRVGKRRRAFLNHYSLVQSLVSTVTAPHHGSRYNLDDALVERFPCLYVASAGTNSRYGHPHPEVSAMVESKGRGLVTTTEDPRSSFVERIEFPG